MRRKRRRIEIDDNPNPHPDVLFADDPPWSFYVLVLSMDEARGRTLADDQVHLSLDAAYVGWYRQLNLVAIPPLNGVALQSGCRLFELILTVQAFQNLDQYLQANTGHSLEESSWWMVTPSIYQFRAAVRMEQFLPAQGSTDPSTVGQPASRHEDIHVLPRLIVPRNLFGQVLFSMRDR